MKKIIRCMSTVALGGILCFPITSFAAESETSIVNSENLNDEFSIEFEEDTFLEGATLVDENTTVNNGLETTVKTYILPDGTEVIDTFNKPVIEARSKEGTATTTRSRTITNWGTIKITAKFQWYTKGLFSYVKCNSMTATKSLASTAVASTWKTSYTKDYVSIGKATASVDYHLTNSKFPLQYQKGTFKITCKDTGAISDNG